MVFNIQIVDLEDPSTHLIAILKGITSTVSTVMNCLTFSNPGETAEVQDQPQVTTNIPTGSKCDSFATQEEVQKALPSNPQLDRDGNGTACDLLVSGGGGSSHSHNWIIIISGLRLDGE